VRDRMGEDSAEYSQMLRWKVLLLVRGGRLAEAAPLLARARELAERSEAGNEPRLLLSRDEIALAQCLARQRADAVRALDAARGLRHNQVPAWATALEKAIGAACGEGEVAARRAALADARSAVETELGPRAPMLAVMSALPAPES